MKLYGKNPMTVSINYSNAIKSAITVPLGKNQPYLGKVQDLYSRHEKNNNTRNN